MTSCSTCGCAPCVCQSPAILNQPRIIDPTISGGTWVGGTLNGPTINDGTITGSNIVGATIDCSTLGCTQPPGTSNATLATTAFVAGAIIDAISPANAAFCAAVQTCLAGSPSLCSDILTCINTTPGSINNPIAFDPAVNATALQVGVIRLANLAEVQGASCGVALDPCTLQAFFDAGGPNPLWTSFANAVDSLITSSATLCAAVFVCGAAPLNNPAFVGVPTAPTAAPGTNNTQIATTAYVDGTIAASVAATITAGNPAFCAAVSACVGAVGAFASFTVPVSHDGLTGGISGPAIANYGCTVPMGSPAQINVQFNAPQPDLNYIANLSFRGQTGANQLFVSEGGDSPGAGTFSAFSETLGTFVTVNGVTLLSIACPIIQGGTPYSGFVTVVFSR